MDLVIQLVCWSVSKEVSKYERKRIISVIEVKWIAEAHLYADTGFRKGTTYKLTCCLVATRSLSSGTKPSGAKFR